jgi:hypothetical protein
LFCTYWTIVFELTTALLRETDAIKTTANRPRCILLAASAALILTLAGCVTVGPCFNWQEASVENLWFESLPTQAPLKRLAERREARPSDASKEA